jgi:hypothetical protein
LASPANQLTADSFFYLYILYAPESLFFLLRKMQCREPGGHKRMSGREHGSTVLRLLPSSIRIAAIIGLVAAKLAICPLGERWSYPSLLLT